LVNPRDEQALENAIIAFVDKTKTFNSDEIRLYAMQHFSYSEVGKQFTEIYKSLVKK
jgi:hypothetical protein